MTIVNIETKGWIVKPTAELTPKILFKEAQEAENLSQRAIVSLIKAQEAIGEAVNDYHSSTADSQWERSLSVGTSVSFEMLVPRVSFVTPAKITLGFSNASHITRVSELDGVYPDYKVSNKPTELKGLFVTHSASTMSLKIDKEKKVSVGIPASNFIDGLLAEKEISSVGFMHRMFDIARINRASDVPQQRFAEAVQLLTIAPS